jgi:hypothetical protein
MGRVAVYNGAFKGIRNLDKVQAMIASIPDRVVAQVGPAVRKGAEGFVASAKEICPIAPEFEPHPGALRDSGHLEAGAIGALSATAVFDAKADNGAGYAAHVEYGHRARDGGHVPAKPFFWPTWQHEKRKIAARVAAATRAAIRGLGA